MLKYVKAVNFFHRTGVLHEVRSRDKLQAGTAMAEKGISIEAVAISPGFAGSIATATASTVSTSLQKKYNFVIQLQN
jgi:hypothetical protein